MIRKHDLQAGPVFQLSVVNPEISLGTLSPDRDIRRDISCSTASKAGYYCVINLAKRTDDHDKDHKLLSIIRKTLGIPLFQTVVGFPPP